MNKIQSSALPSVSVFNKLTLDSLGVWRGDVIDVEFNVAATEEKRRKALNLAFDEHRNADGTFGPLSSVLKSMQDNAPQDNILQRKARTIQDIVQHFAREDFRSSHELDELEPYIEGVIKERFNDVLLSDFIINTRIALIEHYKEFVREFSPKGLAAADSYQFFISNIAVSVICKSLFSALYYSDSPSELDDGVISFDCKKEGELWPLKAYFDGLLKRSQVSAYELDKFHEVKLNNQSSIDSDIWEMISKSTPVNMKSKQVVKRFGQKTKVSWRIVWKQISPLASRLSIDKKIVQLNSFVAYWIHNIAINIESNVKDDVSFHRALADIYTCIEYSKQKYLVEHKAIYLKPISDVIDDAEYDKSSIPSLMPRLKEELEKYRCFLGRRDFFDKKLLIEDFTNFWKIASKEKINIMRQQTVIEEVYFAAYPDWTKHWCDARSSILAGDMEKALQDYKLSLSSAKYTSGRYFTLLYIDICAFCKMRYRYFSARNETDIFDRFYEELGYNASQYSELLGYTPKTVRNPLTLIPSSKHKLKNGYIMQMIDLTAMQMQNSQASNCI